MGDDLFASASLSAQRSDSPLADRMRPRTLDEFIGQDHIVGHGRLLRRAIQRDRLSSIILSGPPGTGKTTLAKIIAGSTSSRFLSLNAVLSGVQGIRDSIDSAKRERELYSRRTILFVDEVHRWNKAQQDALLPWVENGTIVLIGATTENPFFEVNQALVSRSRVFQLHALTDDDLLKTAQAALSDSERGYGRWEVVFEDGALAHLVATASGDARSLLNALELAVETSAEPWPPADGSSISVSMAAAEESIQKRAVLYDSDGDYHYDAASALIKSVRGSDPDAALYWAARMIYAGEDPRFIFRRLLISACEDIGMADPQAVAVVNACAQAYERIGLPEGQFHVAQAVLYLSTAPKSNSALGYFDALAATETERSEVPNRLKDATADGKAFGHGQGYLYPHAYKGHWQAQQYLPDTLKGRLFYQPGSLGYEATIRQQVLSRRQLQLAAWDALEPGFSPATGIEPTDSRSTASAVSQSIGSRSGAQAIASMRDALFDAAQLTPESRVLVLAADDGILVHEAMRMCPQGSVCALVESASSLAALGYSMDSYEEFSRPDLAAITEPELAAQTAIDAAGHAAFTHILAHDLGIPGGQGTSILASCARAFPTATVILAQRRASGLGVLVSMLTGIVETETLKAFSLADSAFFSQQEHSANEAALSAMLANAGFTPTRCWSATGVYDRMLSEKESTLWLSEQSPYGRAIIAALGTEAVAGLRNALIAQAQKSPVQWPFAWSLCAARLAP